MTDIFLQVIENQNGYFEGGLQLVFFIIALLGLCFAIKHPLSGRYLVYTLVMAVIIYCPISAGVIMWAIGDDVYWRMFWLLPILQVLGIFVVELFPVIWKWGVERFKKLPERAAGAISCGVLFLCLIGFMMGGGCFVYQDGVLMRAGNLEKLPGEVIVLCDNINADHKTHPELRKKVAAAGGVVPYIRQYDATIGMAYGRQTIWDGRDGENQDNIKYKLFTELTMAAVPDYDKLIRYIDKLECDYVILLNDGAVGVDEMGDCGFSFVCDSGNYTLLRRG